MIRYFHFARVAFGDHLNNRLRILTRFLVFMLWAWMMLVMWKLISSTGRLPAGIVPRDIFWYAGFTQMMVFTSPRIFAVVDDDVRSGNIAYFLNRPMPYLWMRFAEGVGALIGNLLLYAVIGIPYLYFLVGGWPTDGIPAVLMVMGLIGSASFLHLLIQMACGLSAFWTSDAIFVYFAYQKLLILLGGMYMPVTLYPDFFYPRVLEFLPFAAVLGNSPALLLSGHDLSLGEVVGLQLFWGIASVLFLSFLYKKCLKGIQVQGG